MVRATTTLTATSFKQKILTVASYYMERSVKNGLQFLIKPFITSPFFLLFRGKETRWEVEDSEGEGECLQTYIEMSREGLNYTVRLGH